VLFGSSVGSEGFVGSALPEKTKIEVSQIND
jgi:hypothetical protein